MENKLKKISETNVPYIIVGGHFPVYSAAEHGPTQCLVDRLMPLLHKYKVSAYLCGHDHNLQHISNTFLNHTSESVKKLFHLRKKDLALVVDGTYCRCEKSNNNSFQYTVNTRLSGIGFRFFSFFVLDD